MREAIVLYYDSIYIKFENWQNQYMLLMGRRSLVLDLGADYKRRNSLWQLIKLHVYDLCTFSVCGLHFQKLLMKISSLV